MTETWTTESISVEGFIVHSRDAVKCKGVKSGRSSGGVIVLIKENLRKYVKVIKLAPTYGVWVKIDRTHINSDKHLFIGRAYFPLQGSKYSAKNLRTKLEKDLSTNGDILLLGDFNARCGNLKDCIQNANGDTKAEFIYNTNQTTPRPDS